MKFEFKLVAFILASGVAALFNCSSVKADSIYTDAAAFSNAISTPNYYTNFVGLGTAALSQPFDLSGNGYSTAITTGSGTNLAAAGGHIYDASSSAFRSLIFSFSAGEDVTALGGDFFDGSSVNVLATLNDGTHYLLNAASGFIGFTSADPITSLTITAPVGDLPGANSIRFGGAVPEPSTYALFGFGLIALVISLRQKHKASSVPL